MSVPGLQDIPAAKGGLLSQTRRQIGGIADDHEFRTVRESGAKRVSRPLPFPLPGLLDGFVSSFTRVGRGLLDLTADRFLRPGRKSLS